jgi:hypothetical protein
MVAGADRRIISVDGGIPATCVGGWVSLRDIALGETDSLAKNTELWDMIDNAVLGGFIMASAKSLNEEAINALPC